VLVNALPDDHAVQPAAFQAAVFLVDADLPEPERAAERAARRVEREDAREELPVSASPRLVDEGGDERATGASATGGSIDVDGELADARGAGSRAVGAATGAARESAT